LRFYPHSDHLGTAEVPGTGRAGPTIAPQETSVARLLLERPLVARGGDRFVIRSFFAVTTIAAGCARSLSA